jgi:predicted enzyme related to lactoylglutathione lyase
MNSVVHFEMPYKDRERMSRFYEKAFGWHTQDLGEAMGHYVLATTTETDERGPIRPGAINGGFYSPKPDFPAPFPAVVIGVEDLAAAIREVRDCGGTVLGDPVEIPDYGHYVSFTDTEGNRVALMEPLLHHKLKAKERSLPVPAPAERVEATAVATA